MCSYVFLGSTVHLGETAMLPHVYVHTEGVTVIAISISVNKELAATNLIHFQMLYCIYINF